MNEDWKDHWDKEYNRRCFPTEIVVEVIEPTPHYSRVTGSGTVLELVVDNG